MQNPIDTLNSVLPPKYQALLALTLLAAQYGGRAYHALVNNGGLRGVIGGCIFGTNTPPATKALIPAAPAEPAKENPTAK